MLSVISEKNFQTNPSSFENTIALNQSLQEEISSKIDIKLSKLSDIKHNTNRMEQENKDLGHKKSVAEKKRIDAIQVKKKLSEEKLGVEHDIKTSQKLKEEKEGQLSLVKNRKSELCSVKVIHEDQAKEKDKSIKIVQTSLNVAQDGLQQTANFISIKQKQISDAQMNYNISVNSADNRIGQINSQISSKESSKNLYERGKTTKYDEKREIANSKIGQIEKRIVAAESEYKAIASKSSVLSSAPNCNDSSLYLRESYTVREKAESMPITNQACKGFGVFGLLWSPFDLVTAPFRDSYKDVTKYRYVLNAQKHKEVLKAAKDRQLNCERELQNLKQTEKSLEQDISNYNNRISELEQEISSCKREKNYVYQTKIEAQNNYTSIYNQNNSEISRLQEEKNQTSNRISQMREKIRAEQQERDEVARKVIEVDGLICQVNETIGAKELELENLKSLLGKKHNNLSNLNIQISQKIMEVESYRREAEEAKAKIEENETEMRDLVANIAEIESKADFGSTAELWSEQKTDFENTLSELKELLELQGMIQEESEEISAIGNYSECKHDLG